MIQAAAAEVFAARGYDGASIDEIVRRAGVSAPVLYDHFASKADLYRCLLEGTRDEFFEVWRSNLATDEPEASQFARAVNAWAAYVETHPDASKIYFHETTGDPQIRAIHRDVQARMRIALAGIIGQRRAAPNVAGVAGAQVLEMAAEVIRAGLAGLAVWWGEHPDVPRERIVATAVDEIWNGLGRHRLRESWPETPAPDIDVE